MKGDNTLFAWQDYAEVALALLEPLRFHLRDTTGHQRLTNRKDDR